MGSHRLCIPGTPIVLARSNRSDRSSKLLGCQAACRSVTALTFLALTAALPMVKSYAQEKKPMLRTIDENGFHTLNGERFWSRPLYGPNRRCFVPAGELPHAALLWFAPQERAYVRCGHFLPGVVTDRGAKWLYEAEETIATYDPGMMRFTVKDPAFDGEMRLEVVPLVDSDGYAVRVTCSAPLQFAFTFGGFWSMPDKDNHQGNSDLSGWLIAEHYEGMEYAEQTDAVACCVLPNITGRDGKPLNMALKVYLLTDRKTRASLHGTRSGISLKDLLTQRPGSASVQVHQVALAANQDLNLAVVVPRTAKPEAEVRDLVGRLPEVFEECKRHFHGVSDRVVLETPDTLVDLGARALSVSMDALWVPPTFMHGPIRWGWSGLAGWRMAYGADVCGDHDRVASHCRYYGERRHKGGLDRKPRADPAALLTRQAGDSLTFSQGRLDTWVYNMTEMWLSFVAHYYSWTGDREYLRELWPAIRDAVGYQKRALDMDNDSLYENYANTYITDAHWHNGGNCTQASAYTYRGNLLAAEAARIVGESPEPFLGEAARIKEAMNRVLWVKEKGVFAEWKDILGEKLRHEDPELGALYLPIDFGVADEFQAYQMLRFTECGLDNWSFEEVGPQPFEQYLYPNRHATYSFPQPMRAREIMSSNWRPLVATTHEVSPGELMDTARCYLKLGLKDRAFPIVKAVLRCMVNLTTPGGLVIRAQNTEKPARCWSNGDIDHCDTLGPSLQCLAEGLFGIHPELPAGLLEIQPGFPSSWDHASIKLRDISYSFHRQGSTDTFKVTTPRPTAKRLRVVLTGDGVSVKVDGKAVASPRVVPGICHPFIEVEAPKGQTAEFAIVHSTQPLPLVQHPPVAARGLQFAATCRNGSILELKDPQGIFSEGKRAANRFSAKVAGSLGHHTAFLKVKGKATEFWQPIDVEVRPPLEIVDAQLADDARLLSFALRNNTGAVRSVEATAECAGRRVPVVARIASGSKSETLSLSLDSAAGLVPGPNLVTLSVGGKPISAMRVECWDLLKRDPRLKDSLRFEPLDISQHLNDDLSLVHTHEYLSPRSPYCSLQPGIDLFREWCSCSAQPCGVLDLGILKEALAKNNGLLLTEPGIPFRSAAEGQNIVFVSQWDNFPKRVTIPVGRSARHVYLLMASVTNPMQSGVVNGRVVLSLGGGRTETLELINPGNLSWCVTSYPNRYGPLYLTQPAVQLGEHVYGTIYSLPLPASAQVEAVTVEAACIESVIGLMAVTLLLPSPVH